MEETIIIPSKYFILIRDIWQRCEDLYGDDNHFLISIEWIKQADGRIIPNNDKDECDISIKYLYHLKVGVDRLIKDEDLHDLDIGELNSFRNYLDEIK